MHAELIEKLRFLVRKNMYPNNMRLNASANKQEFQEFVLANVQHFDAEAWCLFCECIWLDVKEICEDIEYYKRIYPYLHAAFGSDRFGYRVQRRTEVLLNVLEGVCLLRLCPCCGAAFTPIEDTQLEKCAKCEPIKQIL
jgi:hypothetical protein